MLPLPKDELASHRIRTARALAEERRRAPEAWQLKTACDACDRLLAGGLKRGAMTELVGGRSSGRFSLVATVLAAVTGGGEAAALIDCGDGLEPRLAAAAGVDLERLLWVRPRHLKQALASAEVILTSGIPLLVIDLGVPPIRGGRGAEASWLRLARGARAHRAALLVSSPYRASGTAAQTVLRADRARTLWTGHGAAPRLLRGIDAGLELLKTRGRRPGTPRQGDAATLDWRAIDDLENDETRRDAALEPAAALPFRPRAVA